MNKKSMIWSRLTTRWPMLAIFLLSPALVLFSGCQTQTPAPNYSNEGIPQPDRSQSIILREGDVVRISFPTTPSLDAVQPIRRDGNIVLSSVGEVKAVGKTPAILEKELRELYSSQVATKDLTVTIESSSYPVFVTGAVSKPGKIVSDHPMTALEAIMEAGGFDYARANLKSVRIIRNRDTHVENYTINLKNVMGGQQTAPFYVKPADIIYVPEKFNWF